MSGACRAATRRTIVDGHVHRAVPQARLPMPRRRGECDGTVAAHGGDPAPGGRHPCRSVVPSVVVVLAVRRRPGQRGSRSRPRPGWCRRRTGAPESRGARSASCRALFGHHGEGGRRSVGEAGAGGGRAGDRAQLPPVAVRRHRVAGDRRATIVGRGRPGIVIAPSLVSAVTLVGAFGVVNGVTRSRSWAHWCPARPSATTVTV